MMNMTFVNEIAKYSWSELSDSIYGKTKRDVERALGKSKRDIEDFKALISPAAAPYLERNGAAKSCKYH